jgi:uncharacterized protein (TIGR01777 family)
MAAGPDETAWDPARGLVDASRLDEVDAVVHLAGENIASGRWTPARKAEIRRSRVVGTRNLCEVLARLPHPPKVLVSASAIGLYGDRGAEILTEESAAGTGFLAEVCREWEAAAEPAARVGIRVVNLRFGMVLSPTGGALKKMLLPFKLGMGGSAAASSSRVGSLDDVIRAIHRSLRGIGSECRQCRHDPVTNGDAYAGTRPPAADAAPRAGLRGSAGLRRDG